MAYGEMATVTSLTDGSTRDGLITDESYKEGWIEIELDGEKKIFARTDPRGRRSATAWYDRDDVMGDPYEIDLMEGRSLKAAMGMQDAELGKKRK